MNDLEALKNHPNAISIFQSRIQLKKNNGGYLAKCPFHDDSKPSFSLDTKQGPWLFNCYGCKEAGDVLAFVQKYEGVDFKEAVKIVERELAGWDTTKKSSSTFHPVIEQSKQYKTYPIELYLKYETALEQSQDARDWLIQKRGITYETAHKLHLGFRQELPWYEGAARSKGWIILPCFRGDTVVSLKYRSIAEKAFTRQAGMLPAALFGSEIDAFTDVLMVTEGELDTAVLVQAGFNAVSIPSSSAEVTPEMRDDIAQAGKIVLAGDSDPAGKEAMTRLYNQLRDKVFLLDWPFGMKDANQTYLEHCKGNMDTFKNLVNVLIGKASPMPGVYSLADIMVNSTRTNLNDHPNRLRFPWKNVDQMVNLLPGSVLAISASMTGMGKTTFLENVCEYAALKGEIVLNYSAELSIEEYSTLVAAHVLKKDRNVLESDDYKEAAKIIKDCKFYIGRNPDLITVGPVLDLIESGIRRLGATLVILDHLHFLTRNETDTIKAQENASQRFKNMMVKYGCKGIIVGQPRKASQQTRGKIIMMPDFKGSESFCSDADAVMLIHRDLVSDFDPNNPPKEQYDSRTQIHLLKGRSQGSGGAYAELIFLGANANFSEISYQKPEELTSVL